MFKDVNDVVLVFLLLTLTNFTPFSSVSIIDFEQGNISRAYSLPRDWLKYCERYETYDVVKIARSLHLLEIPNIF